MEFDFGERRPSARGLPRMAGEGRGPFRAARSAADTGAQPVRTPIATLAIPDSERTNDALAERSLKREKTAASVRHSHWGGWQSATDFPDWCGAEGEAVLSAAQTVATSLTSDRTGRPVTPTWHPNSRANVNRAGQGSQFHTHPGAYWSATYHVRDGGAGSDPILGGEFEMADPRGVGPAMSAPLLAIRIPGGQSVGASEMIRPVPGMLVLFQSWLSHDVRPNEGDQVRISIAINLTPT